MSNFEMTGKTTSDFEIYITNNYFRIDYFNEIVRDNWDTDYLETFDEIYKYIDDVISEEA